VSIASPSWSAGRWNGCSGRRWETLFMRCKKASCGFPSSRYRESDRWPTSNAQSLSIRFWKASVRYSRKNRYPGRYKSDCRQR
jgi:hypothetical protein